MIRYELKPEHDNLLTTYKNDAIGRNADLFNFVEILNYIDNSCSISVDGAWGSGKTFFVKQAKMIIDAYNEHIAFVCENDRKTITNLFRSRKGISLIPQVTVYYDAWENDNDDDPMLSLVYSIMQSVSTDFDLKAGPDFVKFGLEVIDFFTGKNWSRIVDALKGNDPLAELKSKKNLNQEIAEFLDSLLAERGDRLIVFIDELDRCKPDFAVHLLERIKHYFSNDRITFVFSTNLKELQHTIKSMYGNGFDACKYLDKFFDISVSLLQTDMDRYLGSIGSKINVSSNDYELICYRVIKSFCLEMRTTAHFLRLMKLSAPDFVSMPNSFMFNENDAALLILSKYILPIAIGLKISDIDRYNAFLSGKDPTPLIDILFSFPNWSVFLLNDKETYEKELAQEKTLVDKKERIGEMYSAIFAQDDNSNGKRIGRCYFSQASRKDLMSMISSISKFSKPNALSGGAGNE